MQYWQRAKKVVSDSPGLVDFAIENSVLNLPDGQVKFFEEFKLQKNCEINLLIKTLLGLVEMMFGLVNVSSSLPGWQAGRMTFFAPCIGNSHLYQVILKLVLQTHFGEFYHCLFPNKRKKLLSTLYRCLLVAIRGGHEGLMWQIELFFK